MKKREKRNNSRLVFLSHSVSLEAGEAYPPSPISEPDSELLKCGRKKGKRKKEGKEEERKDIVEKEKNEKGGW